MSPLERAERIQAERLKRFGFSAWVTRLPAALHVRLAHDLFWSKFEARP